MENKSDNQSSFFNKIFIGIFIILLMGIAVIFSLEVLSKQSLRLDESQSLWQSSHSIPKIINIVAEDVHVPFYHMILHFWQMFLGNDVATARLISLIFFLLTIPMVYLLARSTLNKTTALFSALLIAISPFLNWYASEIRMYTMLTFFTVLSQYFYMRIYRKNDKFSWTGYVLVGIMGLFTHYFFVFILLTQATFYFLYKRTFPAQAFKKFLISAGLIAAAFLPWILYVLKLGAASNTRPLLSKPTTVDLFNTFSQFFFGFQDDHVNTLIVSLWPIVILLIFLFLRRNKKVPPTVIYFFISAIFPVIIVFLSSLFIRPFFLSRYLIVALPSLYIFIGWLFSTFSKEVGNALKIILAATMLFTFFIQSTSLNTPVEENYREATEYLSDKTTSQDIIILSAPFTIYPVEYYYHGSAQLSTLPIWNQENSGVIPPFDKDRLPEEVNSLKGTHKSAWLLLSYNQGYEKDIKSYFDSHFEMLSSKNFPPGINLYEYKLRYDVANFNK